MCMKYNFVSHFKFYLCRSYQFYPIWSFLDTVKYNDHLTCLFATVLYQSKPSRSRTYSRRYWNWYLTNYRISRTLTNLYRLLIRYWQTKGNTNKNAQYFLPETPPMPSEELMIAPIPNDVTPEVSSTSLRSSIFLWQ